MKPGTKVNIYKMVGRTWQPIIKRGIVIATTTTGATVLDPAHKWSDRGNAEWFPFQARLQYMQPAN